MRLATQGCLTFLLGLIAITSPLWLFLIFAAVASR